MFDKWFNLPAHLYLKLTALIILAVGVAVSNVLMSIGTIWIISNWLIEADYLNYWKRFKKKKSVWFIVALFFFLMITIAWSTNSAYAVKDLRVKLPLIVIPLVLATSAPLSRSHFYFIMYAFLGVVSFTSIYNYVNYNLFLPDGADIREMSVFISHVRFSVLLNLSLFIAVYFGIKKILNPILSSLICLWLLFYLYESQVLNGYLLFVILTVFSFWYGLFKLKNLRLKILVMFAFGLILSAVIFQVNKLLHTLKTPEIINYTELELKTINGEDYYHDTLNKQLENGNFVWIYVAVDELKDEWSKRSRIDFDSTDAKGQPMYGTLMRYLTSKGLRKDAQGVKTLNDAEIKLIEDGVTSSVINDGLVTRLNTFLMEFAIYQVGGDPNGSSIIQRIEHLKAARGLIQKNWLFGVGVGDVADAFKIQYSRMGSSLVEENQHRSHNQFLTIWVAGGIVALLLFLGMLIMPIFELQSKDYFVWIVLLSLYISCLFQDIIETQAGVTIVGLFYALAVYRENEGVNPVAHP